MKEQILKFIKKPRRLEASNYRIIEDYYYTDFDDKVEFRIVGEFERFERPENSGNDPENYTLTYYASLVRIEAIEYESKQFTCNILDIDSVFTEEEQQEIINEFKEIVLT